MDIFGIKKKYYKKLSPFELEILISHAIKKTREFVLAHPEYNIRKTRNSKLETFILRRINHEPIAYITGHKDFYGLDFEVNKSTLIPRPETEQIVELVTHNLKRNINKDKMLRDTRYIICDIGTGSGNIIISIAKQLGDLRSDIHDLSFFATDISKDALKVARKNALNHGVNKKIEFLHGNLLEPLVQNFKFQISNFKSSTNKKFLNNKQNNLVIVANLPYLSKKIYKSTPEDVKKYEPKTALYSDNHGLAHYEKLLKQIKLLITDYELPFTAFLEISPEQKLLLSKIIKKHLPKSKIKFHKDLAGKWRVCEISL